MVKEFKCPECGNETSLKNDLKHEKGFFSGKRLHTSQFCTKKSKSTQGVILDQLTFKLLPIFVKLVKVINLYVNLP